MAHLCNRSDVHKQKAWHGMQVTATSATTVITVTEVQKFWIFAYQTIWNTLQQTPQQMSLVFSFFLSGKYFLDTLEFEINEISLRSMYAY